MTDLLTRPCAGSRPGAAVDRTVVEIHDGERWVPVCGLDDLLPGRGVAVLLGTDQVALFRDRDRDGRAECEAREDCEDREAVLYALDNRDPFSGAQVLSRGLLGSRGRTQVLISPMLKQAFDLESGRCLDEDTAPDGSGTTLRRWPVRATRPGAAGTPMEGSR